MGVPERAEIIPFEHDEVILGMEERTHFHLPRILGRFFMVAYLFYPLIATIVLFLAAFVFYVIEKQKGENANPLAKRLLILSTILVFTALAVCVPLHLRNEFKNSEFLIQPMYFYPMLAALVAVVLGIGFFVYAKKTDRFVDQAKYVLGVTILAALVMVSVCLIFYFKRTIAPDEYYSSVSSTWLSVGAAAIAIVLAVLFVFFGRNSSKKSETKSVTYAAVCVAMSFALSFISLFKLPQGGTITLVSLLPLMLYSQMFGIRKGIMAGLVYGLLQAIQDPWILHPAQFLLDYPIAFACIGLCSIFTQNGIKDKKDLVLFGCGSVLAVIMRYLSHVVSGIFAFSMYAAEGYGAVAWGFLYNTFAFADMALALTLGIILLCNKSFLKIINRITTLTLPVPTEKPENLSSNEQTTDSLEFPDVGKVLSEEEDKD